MENEAMYIYSEAFELVVYIPATDDLAAKADGVAIWIIPGFDRDGENDAYGIDNEFNS
jgi:hypothetical protein